jgi:predicted Rossmann-fold nucleotide-binding protein
MQASAHGAKSVGGRTIGIVTEALGTRKPNGWIDETVLTKTLVDRLMQLISRGEAYVVLKGGTGTLLELAAVWEFMNKGLVREKPIVVVGDFWNNVIGTLQEELAWEGLENCTRYVTVVESAAECAAYISSRLNEGIHVGQKT